MPVPLSSLGKSLVLLLLLTLLLPGYILAGNPEQREIKVFTKLVVSQNIEVYLKKGEPRVIVIPESGILAEDVITRVSGKTLNIYLDGQKLFDKKRYSKSRVKVIVFFDELKKIELRGDRDLTCKDPIAAEKLKLIIMGDSHVQFVSLHVGLFKVRIYGDCQLEIGSGIALEQEYKIYGSANVKASSLKSEYVWAKVWGDSNIELAIRDQLDLEIMGDTVIRYRGHPRINKRLVMGDLSLRRMK